jgi:signal transduction histidine kinase
MIPNTSNNFSFRIYCLFCFLFLSFFISCVPVDSKLPTLAKGKLDIIGLDPSIDVIPLHGEWEFYPSVFISSIDAIHEQDRKILLNVPGNWNSVYANGNGYGTYRAKIRIPESWNFPIALKISDQGTAYRLFVNQIEVVANGSVGRVAEESLPHALPVITPSLDVSSELEILFHVSNFHFREGGLWYPIYIGNRNTLLKMREDSLNLDIFLLGSISIMGVYHLFLFFIRRRDFSPLWFSLFCFTIIFRLLSFNEKYIYNIIPSISFLWLSRMQYVSYFLALPLFSQFIFSIYPGIYYARVKQFIWFVTGIFCLIVLFTDTGLFSHTAPYFHILTILSSLYFLFIIVKAFVKKEQSASLLFLGTIVLLIGTVNDILYSMEYIHSSFVIPQSLLFFIFLQSVILSIRFSSALHENEILSSKLKNINENLEIKIQERTMQYKEEKEKAEEANRWKGKFIELVSHNIRSPLYGVYSALHLISSDEYLEVNEKDEILKSAKSTLLNTTSAVENLLHSSRFLDDSIQVQLSFLNPYEILENLLIEIAISVKSKNIQIDNLVTKNFIIYGDSYITNEVFRNILTNAIKFTPVNGKIKIESEESGEYKIVHFSDTGIGISDELLPEIFQMNVSRKGTTGEKGFGIGLKRSLDMMQLQSGMIQVISRVNQGSRFSVCFPKKES